MSADRPADTDAVWKREPIESPCVKVCVLDPRAGVCMGCYRTGEEIRLWMRYSPEQRRTIMAGLPERAEAVDAARPRRRGGREGRLRGQPDTP